MLDLEPFEANDGATVFRDVIFLALLGFVTIVVLLLPHLHPPASAEASVEPPGNLVVELRWPQEIDADVDLWIEAPSDAPVGYSNKGGRIFNLLRDDLGHPGDVTGLNHEIAYSRGIPAGEYTVNLHLFRNNGAYPVPAVVVISLKVRADDPLVPLTTEEVRLQTAGQELTVARFSLDHSGRLVPGSLHRLPRPLRAAQRG
jgi:hypothetical protein